MYHARMAIRSLLHVVLWLAASCSCAAGGNAPPVPHVNIVSRDWLIDGSPFAATVRREAVPGGSPDDVGNDDRRQIVLDNGLVRRVIRTWPGAATVAIDNLMTRASELRSVRPEATVTINGNECSLGGLLGQPIHNYLDPKWLDSMTDDPAAWRLVSVTTGKTEPRMDWKPRTQWLSVSPAWPPAGVSVHLEFAPLGGQFAGVTATVHYELYDGIPLLSKWITVANNGPVSITVDAFKAEILATVEPTSMVGGNESAFAAFPRSMHVETEYAFGGSMDTSLDSPGVRWKVDPLYQTQVNYERRTPCLLECSPHHGPAQVLAPGETFESFRVFELLYDSTDRERRGLSLRRMYRVIAPWVQENPLIFHVRSADPAAVRAAIDQAATVGFELVIMTFGSGFDIENTDPAYRDQLRRLADEAHARGVALGGYSLLASRSIDEHNDVVNPATGKPGGFATFGNSPCIGSPWGRSYFEKLYAMFEATGLDVLEHDGSYPGDVCASTDHPGHRGLQDSQWSQWRTITEFYRWCRSRGVYLNVPDWYYLAGSNKCGMGYRETNWSLPREQQEIIERQNIHDGTWTKTPSMGWMFVPLTEYHGGGPAATIEPLADHLDHYERRLMNLLGAGVQACYRGPRLYDTDATREMVGRWVAWYKQHRAILDSDVIHGPRPDGRNLDWLLHVNPALATPGMLVVYNPSEQAVSVDLPVNVYYTGLRTQARVRGAAGNAITVPVDPRGLAMIPVTVPARGVAWYEFSP
ncbi:MAG: hypothetical protein GIKADHBN_00635 [Phycisphaerales bacterium]|nr:hypothetical protein [Phycisphaerales bacterium]